MVFELIDESHDSAGTTEDAVLIEDAVIAAERSHLNDHVPQCCLGGWRTQQAFCPDVKKGEMVGHHLRDHMASDHIKKTFHLVRSCWQDKSRLIH